MSLGTASGSLLQRYRLAFEDAGFSLLIALGISTAVVLGFAMSNPAVIHWFVIPVLLCGMLTISDLIDWIRGRCDLLDPIGIISLLSTHLLFVAPLLHVSWNYWMLRVAAPADWRVWLGGMAIFNAIGLVAYRMVRTAPVRQPNLQHGYEWKLNYRRFFTLVTIGMLVSVAAQAYIYIAKGGILGYILAYETRQYGGGFAGFGPLFAIAEPLPLLAIMTFAVITTRSKKPWLKNWLVMSGVLLGFLILLLLFGGLRGSRSNIMYALFWGAGILHIWVRRIPRPLVLAGIGFMLIFIYVYSFYKGGGVEAISAVGNQEDREEMSEQTDRGWERVALGDLGRSDVQAYLLYRLMVPTAPYAYGLGSTYIGAATVVVPSSLWLDRPSKVKQGTLLQYGLTKYEPDKQRSSRIYGLAGETMLNFGPFAIPLAFIVFGLWIRKVRSIMLFSGKEDVHRFFLPLLIIASIHLFMNDLDNVAFYVLKNGAVPFAVILLSCTRVARAPKGPHTAETPLHQSEVR